MVPSEPVRNIDETGDIFGDRLHDPVGVDLYWRIRASELELVGLRAVLLQVDVDQHLPTILLSRVDHLRQQLPVPDRPLLIRVLSRIVI